MHLSSSARLALGILRVYRLAQLLAYDDGPLFAFKRIRLTCGRLASGDGAYGHWRSLAEFVRCPYCLGMWLAILAAFLVIIAHPLADLVLLILGLAGGQAFLEGIGGHHGTE